MEFINPIAAIIAIILAIFSIPKTLQIIAEQRRKKFKDELENFSEYFEKYYKNHSNEFPQLLKDKAAQNLTRTKEVNSELLDYIIDLHENKLANFDKLTDHYHWGQKYIEIEKNNDKFVFSKKGIHFIFFYIIYIFAASFAGFIYLDIVKVSDLFAFDKLTIFISLSLAIWALKNADERKEASNFFKSLKVLDEKTEITKPCDTLYLSEKNKKNLSSEIE